MILFIGIAGKAYAMPGAAKQKLAILPFTAKNIEAITLTESLSSLLLSNIDRAGHFEILERKKIEIIIEVEGLWFESMTKEDIFKIGARNGIDFLLSGYITRVAGTLAVDMQLLSVRGQKVCLSSTIRTSEGELSVKLYDAAQEILKSARECLSSDIAIAADKKRLPPPENIKIGGTSTSIRLSWSHPDMPNLIGFKVFRAVDENGHFTQIAVTSQDTYTDENLKLNEVFYYKIKAVSKAGADSEFSAHVAGKTSTAPHPPIFLGLQADIKGMHLQWRPRPQSAKGSDVIEAGYKVYRKTSQEKEFKEIAVVSAENTTYSDSGLRDAVIYVYALTAFNSARTESDFSASLDSTTPAGVAGLEAEGGKIRRIPLKWSAHAGDVVEGYWIYRATEKNGEYKKLLQIPGRQSVSHADILPDDETCWYRITAYNKNNIETDLSAPVSATTRPKPPVPAGLAAKSGEPRRVSLTWETIKSTDDEIKGYRIYRSEEKKGEYKKTAEIDAEKNSFTDEHYPLKDNRVYYYKISSYNSAGSESQHSKEVSAVTKALPQAPAGVKAVSGEVKKVSVVWDKNPEADIKEYIVHRRKSDEKDFEEISSTKETSYIDSGLKDGMEYIYALQARDNDSLLSRLAAPVVAKTKPLPQKPAGLKISDKDGKKTISWDANPEKDIKQYSICKKGFLGISQKITTVQTNLWEITGLKGKVEIFVTAVDDAGLESEASDAVEVELK
jgi:fibronectin type 3 domain-containing protein/TolB-like protein